MATKTKSAKSGRSNIPKSIGNASKQMAKTRLSSVQADQKIGQVRRLRESFGVSRKMFARLVGFSERAVADWEADKPLSDVSSQRIKEIARLQLALANVMAKEFVGQWLSTPNEAWGGLKPIEVVERGEIDRIWRMIYELESGTPS